MPHLPAAGQDGHTEEARENRQLLGTVREFEPVGNALCGVLVRSAASRNGTEAVPYKGLRRFEFPDTLSYFTQAKGPFWHRSGAQEWKRAVLMR